MVKIDEKAKELGFSVKRVCEFRAFYYLVDENGLDVRNRRGEKLCVEIGFCSDPGGKKSLPYLWHEIGYTKEIMKDWWSVQTFVTDCDGNCFRGYDPTIQGSWDGKRLEINFDWHLRATDENHAKLLEEVKRLFLAA